jgi:hypothetical protein
VIITIYKEVVLEKISSVLYKKRSALLCLNCGGMEDTEMEDSLHATTSTPPPFDSTNGTHLFSPKINYTHALMSIFTTLLGYEDVKDWRRKNEHRVKVGFSVVLCDTV